MTEGSVPDAGLFPQSVGERLRVLREIAKLDLTDIATRTRIPLRHLEAIERSDYASLPSQTYALGFTRSYARAIGTDEAPLVSALREELGRTDPALHGHLPYEPVDPARVPSRLLAWTAFVLAIALAAGYGLWRTEFYGSEPALTAITTGTVSPVSGTSERTNPVTQTTTAPATSGTPQTGPVVLTAITPVWLRIYDGKTRLLEKEMAAGEAFTVPESAANPQILTGRPDALKVTVGGREVPPLGSPAQTIKDVGISATALAARSTAPTATTTQ